MKMDVSEEHLRHIMLYEFKRGNTAVMATKSICSIYDHGILNIRKCQRWLKKFKNRNLDLKYEPRFGQPSNLNDAGIKAIVEGNSKLTPREIA